MAERRIATGALPGIRRVGQLLADEQPGAILVDPSTQALTAAARTWRSFWWQAIAGISSS
ncbi:hypothetical protein [Frankia sp. Cj3]|uniref:hypothetical protein n=1 Tax=Frankia sp. Cj3 TaxID=2880976 RepID=UPI001EF3E908|nr:hypothetical protein [Frankia sp. Cj3]